MWQAFRLESDLSDPLCERLMPSGSLLPPECVYAGFPPLIQRSVDFGVETIICVDRSVNMFYTTVMFFC